jgi:predicted GNAT family acetyltransferase
MDRDGHMYRRTHRDVHVHTHIQTDRHIHTYRQTDRHEGCMQVVHTYMDASTRGYGLGFRV